MVPARYIYAFLLLIVPLTNGDKLPYFMPGTGDMSRLEINENTPVGTPVYQLRAVDPEGGSIHYSISGTRLSVDSQTGVVTLRELLDREKQPVIEVIISATDQNDNTVSLRRFIHVSDVNDNVPQFKGRPYSVGVKENAPVGFRLPIDIRVVDADLGRNAEITVSCTQEGDVPCENFVLREEKTSEGQYRVYIEVKRLLDHELRSAHVLTLKARDSGDLRLASNATVHITVLDVQDKPPDFLDAPYSAAVLENSPPGTKVLEVAARDGDTGQSKRKISLRLEGDQLNFFKLLPKTSGTISKATLVTSEVPLDRENPLVQQGGGVYTFDVVATEIDPETGLETGDSSTSQVTVIITDADDQLPEFDSQTYQASVRENLQVDDQIPGLSITVTDNDLGANSRYYLRLESPDFFSAEALKISPEKGEGRTPLLIRVADPSLLDYESGIRNLTVDVVASKQLNGSPLATARINLKILDANDHAPRFARNSYRFNIPENASIGTRIDNLENPLVAQDSDDGEFGHITYSIRGFGAGVFSTDSENGGLRVAAPLDREKQAAYTLAVEAKDGGGKITQVNVHVDILDTNDNYPQFEQREYSRVVREGAKTFDPQLFLRATDVDGETQGGGKIVYSLDESASEWKEVFNVDPTSGEIKILRPVSGNDAPRGQYEFLVRATDLGDPPLFNTTRVIIRVGLIGNQRPIWRGAENDRLYHAQVPETAPAGHLVTTIKAHDPDGPDSQIRYRLANSGEDNFVLNEITGELRISTDSRLDRDVEGAPVKYNILVAAIDGGPGAVKETSTATVQVDILDVNDKVPKFPQQNLTGYISERALEGTKVLRIIATDPDEGSKVQYSIGKVKALDGAGLPVRSGGNYDPKKAFTIDPTSGDLKVNGSLDHRSAAVVLLQIIAEDIGSLEQKQTTSTDVTVYIQAFEDDSPYFVNEGWSHGKPELHVQLEEEKPIGTKVVELRAYDPRMKEEVRRFQMMQKNTDALTVLPDGDVLLTRRVDYERPGDKLLELTVQTVSEDNREAQLHLFVHIVDLNDNPPRFEKDEYFATILESAKHPKVLIKVNATDLDLAETAEEVSRGYGVISYSLASGGPFEIDMKSGEIRIAKGVILDRERQSQYSLEVTARDGGGRKSSCIVKVTVEDVNDNRPHWNSLTPSGELRGVIPENSSPGEKAADLQAFDPDLNEGGILTYEIIDEGDAQGLFSLDEKTGKLSVARALTGKGRTEPYILTIRATDGGGLHSDAPLHMFIGDVSANDGVPEWIKPKIDEVAKISENASVGAIVYKALAEDPDDPRSPSGRISYSLLYGDEPGKVTFVIDNNNGMVTLKKPLDREKKDRYTLVLVAMDNGTPPQQASRVLQVIVMDVDDNQPRFNRLTDDPPQLLEIDEEVPIGTKIGQVQAFDPDLEENAEIGYYITNGNDRGLFSIDSDGVVFSFGRLDREEISQHLLTVKCTKRSAEVPKNLPYNRLDPSQLQVLVHLRDVDDNSPQFVDGDNFTVGVRAWTQTDTLVTRLEAHDLDSTSMPIEYKLIGGNFTPGVKNEDFNLPGAITEVFRLDTTTGELRTIRPLTSFADGAFVLYAEAISGNRSIVATVKVHVARDRDLLRWVFSRPPADVRRDLPDFERSMTESLEGDAIPLIYDARFLARRDGSLDFGSTGACFSLVSNDDTSMTLSREDTLHILALHEEKIQSLYNANRVLAVERCDGASRNEGAVGSLPRATITQAWLLIIALLVGIAGLISCCVLCCMHCNYKKRTTRKMRLLNEISTPIHPPIYPEPLYST